MVDSVLRDRRLRYDTIRYDSGV